MRFPILKALVLIGLGLGLVAPAAAQDVRLKDLGRFQGWRENPLVGYGIVTGLAGSGDSPRSEVTRQALRNVYSRLGINIDAGQIQSRNVAVVIVTARLPASANLGDRIDVTVTSAGDARSLAGGTLLMTPLLGPDQQPYALAQGQLTVGGYKFEADANLQQRNYPTSGTMAGGATVERAVAANILDSDGNVTFILRDPDITGAENVARAVNSEIGAPVATVRGPDAVVIRGRFADRSLNSLLAEVENVRVQTAQVARVVVNEKSGTVVAGGDARISGVTIAQGDIKVEVAVDNTGLQPNVYGGYGGYGGNQRNSDGLIVTNTRLDVAEDRNAVLHMPSATVADLAQGLSRAHVPVRTMIAILQAMKTAGALHAEIVVE